MDTPVRFGIVGGGGRARAFLRVAKELPERFEVSGMVVRDEQKGVELSQMWGVRTYRTISDLLKAESCSFVVVSVPRAAAPGILVELVECGMPALCETPPASSLDNMKELYAKVGRDARIQVAEQYNFRPYHAARLELVRSGLLGDISMAHVSIAHDYHGISMMRTFLDVSFEQAEIQGFAHVAPLLQGPVKEEVPTEYKVEQSKQIFGKFQFGGKLGFYDFAAGQYWSHIRSPRLLVRGERGEINNMEVRYLLDYATPIEGELKRIDAGHHTNIEGFHLKAITFGDKYLYRNPFIPGRYSDDSIAVATCLTKMNEYAGGGQSFYSLAEGLQDHYLALMLKRAVETGEKVHTEKQPWAPM